MQVGEHLDNAVHELCISEFASVPASIAHPRDALDSLGPRQLRSLTRQFRVKTDATDKAGLVEALLASAQRQRTLFDSDSSARLRNAAVRTMGRCVRLHSATRALFSRMEVLFFMKTSLRENTLATVLLKDRGDVTYPTYALHTGTRAARAPMKQTTATATTTAIDCQRECPRGPACATCPARDVAVLHPVFRSRTQLVEYTRALAHEQRLEDAVMGGRAQSVAAELSQAYATWRNIMQRYAWQGDEKKARSQELGGAVRSVSQAE